MVGIKFFGYLLAILGLIGIAVSNKLQTISLLKALPQKSILILAVVLVGIGIILIMSGSKDGKSNLGKEVPIYRGKNIIGYRVMK